MKVLITGAAGFVGTALRKDLSQDHTVRLLDVRQISDPEGEVFQGSVADYDLVNRAMKGVDGVVHMAIVSSNAGMNMGDIDLSFDVNVKGAFNVCRAAWENGVKRIVYTSTGSVWACNPGYEASLSEGGLLAAEDVEPTPGPEYPYGLTKYLAEKVVEVFAKSKKGVPSIILRLGGVGSAGEKWSDVVKSGNYRNRVYVLDVVQGIRLALTNETIQFDVFNISGGFEGTNYPIEKARKVLAYKPMYGPNTI